MSIELNDEVAVPDFEDHLWRELARIHDQDRAELLPAAAARQHRASRRTVLAGVGSLAAAAALVAAIVSTRSGGNDEPDLEAKIISASRAAESDFVVRETTDFAGTPDSADFELWRDETSLSVRTLSYTPNGALVSDRGQTELPPVPPAGLPLGTRQVRTVDYCAHVYMIQEDNSLTPDASVLTPIVDGLTDGYMHVDGTERVGGRELVRVVDDAASFGVWLVDPESYRPLYQRVEVGDGNDRASMTTYDYLPRSPENLAQLQAADPPAGFVQIDEQDWPAEPGPPCD